MSTSAVGVPVSESAYYWQITLEANAVDADRVTEVLDSLGALSISVESANDEDTFDAALPGEPQWQSQKLTALFDGTRSSLELTDALSTLLPGHPVTLGKLEDRDWERVWLEQFVPQKIRPGLWVVPSWAEAPEPDAVNLVIDPGLAFGTGTHPTTRLCLDALAGMTLGGRCVLDYGCGSGILAIGALRLGADHAIATDLDPRALEATVQNAVVNRCDADLQTLDPDSLVGMQPERRADILIANILADTLVELKPRLLSLLAPGGTILLSGILHHQADRVAEAFGDDFRFERRQQGDWMLLLGLPRELTNHAREF